MFQNESMMTADFDGSLILNGEWDFEWNGNTLVLIKENGDKYTLSK